MSEIVFRSECLNAVLEQSRDASPEDIVHLVNDAITSVFTHTKGSGYRVQYDDKDNCSNASSNSSIPRRELFRAARMLQRQHKSRTVTFSKKAFLNVVNLCRDTCTYCTYKAEPRQSKAVMMSRQDADSILSMASRYGCIEALIVTGERPEERYDQARRWLAENGFKSTAEYLVHISERALEKGLFPHTNAGNLQRSEMVELQKTNVSMGVMLETASNRLSEPGMVHHLAPSKRPEERIKVLEEAGRLGIPMTTGLLLGIGETVHEVVASLEAIRRLHQRYANIQEVILQNFQPKPDTAMRRSPPADAGYFMAVVAACRVMMPDINIQIPPNLSPDTYHEFLSVGINDWGGVSPLTPDYVNPEFPWPAIQRLEADTRSAGCELECRFPVYPEFTHMVPADLCDKMSDVAQSEDIMLVSRERWRRW